jgi:hypothetical protein
MGSPPRVLQIRSKGLVSLAFPGDGYHNSIVKYDDRVAINGNYGGKYSNGVFIPNETCTKSQ